MRGRLDSRKCKVKNCKSIVLESGVSFFRIPKVIEHQGEQMREITLRRRRAWLKNIDRSDLVASDLNRVCSLHFHSGKPAYVMDETNPDWAPTLHMGTRTQESSPGCYEMRIARNKQKSASSQNASTYEALQAFAKTIQLQIETKAQEANQDPLSSTGCGIEDPLNCENFTSLLSDYAVNDPGDTLPEVVLVDNPEVTPNDQPQLPQNQESIKATTIQEEDSCAQKNCDNIIKLMQKQIAKLMRENKQLKAQNEMYMNKCSELQGKLDSLPK